MLVMTFCSVLGGLVCLFLKETAPARVAAAAANRRAAETAHSTAV